MSDWGKRPKKTDDGNQAAAGGPSESARNWEGPTGTVNVESVLFEEVGQYGAVFILTLADFLKALGSYSTRTVASMQLICETVFREHLGTEGSYSLHSGAFFVFRFGRMEPEEARRRAFAAVNEIGRRLLGDHFIGRAEIPAGEPVPPAASARDMKRETDEAILKALRGEVRQAADSDWKVPPATAPDADRQEISGPEVAPQTRRTLHNDARRQAAEDGKGKGGASAPGVPPRSNKAAER